MFPTNIITTPEEIIENNGKVISDDSKIYKTPDFDFEKKQIVLKNGNVNLLDDYQNTRNWIILFLKTPIDTYKIYEGTGFGTSAHKLRGYKNVSGTV